MPESWLCLRKVAVRHPGPTGSQVEVRDLRIHQHNKSQLLIKKQEVNKNNQFEPAVSVILQQVPSHTDVRKEEEDHQIPQVQNLYRLHRLQAVQMKKEKKKHIQKLW